MTSTAALRLLLVLAAFAVGAAGCGGDEGGGSGGGESGAAPAGQSDVAAAKQRLVDSCHEGNEGDQKDLELCRCTADKLEQDEGLDAAAIDKAVKDVESGSVPPQVAKALAACQ